MKYGISFNCMVTVGGTPIGDTNYVQGGVGHDVGGACDGDTSMDGISDTAEKLIESFEEDGYKFVREHEMIGGVVEDMGGKVVAVMVEEEDPDYTVAVIFEDPEEVPTF